MKIVGTVLTAVRGVRARERRAQYGLRVFFLGVLALEAALVAQRELALPARPEYGVNQVSNLSAIDQSILPEPYQTTWDPGIPGGIPSDGDSIRPASIWLPTGTPYGGYSVNPALTGTSNAAAFTSALQAAIASAGAEAAASATPTTFPRRIVRLKAGTYYVSPQTLPPPGPAGQVGIYVNVDNVTIRGEGADTTRLAAAGKISNYGTVVLFGHRRGTSDADFAVQTLTVPAEKGDTSFRWRMPVSIRSETSSLSTASMAMPHSHQL